MRFSQFATLRFYYTDAEAAAAGLSEGNLRLYQFNGATWEYQGGINDTVANYVELAGVSAFSEWALADPADNPLPVELVSFTSVATPNGAKLSWSTASERPHASFDIRRREYQPSQAET